MIKLILEERARINVTDDYKSLFPFYKYGIVVKRESPDSNTPHIFIYDSAKQWKWKIELDTLKICEFYSRGKRLDFNPQQFEEIINNLKTRVCPSAPHSVYQALTFAQYYTPNSRDTWEGSGCRFRVRLFQYKLQNYSCLRQIYK